MPCPRRQCSFGGTPPHISSGRGEAWSQPLLSPSPSPAIPCSATGHGDGHGSPRTLDTQISRYLATSLSPLSQYLHTIYAVLTAHNAGLGVVARVQDSPWLRRAQPPHSSQHASTGPAAPYTEAQQHLSRSTHPDSVMTSTSIVLHLCFFVTFWWLPILQMWKKRLKNHIFVIIWNKKTNDLDCSMKPSSIFYNKFLVLWQMFTFVCRCSSN